MPTYCTLADAYGPTWGKPNIDGNKKEIIEVNKKREERYAKAEIAPKGEIIDTQKGDFPACPNCQHCLNQNNQFQQKVVNAAIGPLPQWIPQSPNIQRWDPFTRYITPRIENFGNMSSDNTHHLLQLVLYLLIALFVIQLVELIGGLN